MMDIDREAAALRRCVEREDFAGVPLVLARYARLVEAEKSETGLAQACELMEWARRNLLASRERMFAEREQLRGVAYYQAPAGAPVCMFRVDG
jgi:hypothetical protein